MFGIESQIVLKLFLNTIGKTSPENQRNISKSYVLMSSFIIKQNKSAQTNTYYIDSVNDNLKAL